jgi:uncharacterized membrane protein (DUF4010 family)
VIAADASVAPSEVEAALRLAIAALVGVGVGLERQWSGHTSGPDARFAGLRTFTLIGGLGGVAGLLLSQGQAAAAVALVAGAIALAVTAFVVAVRRPGAELDATTEVAALVVVALGTLSGLGWITLAAGSGALVVLLLHEKTRMHAAVARLDETELKAALRFAVLALVVLPLLPRSTSIGGVEFSPRSLWAIVLFFSGLNFAAYVARRFVRGDRGFVITGMLGGFISSTAVTLDFSRRSRVAGAASGALAAGVIGACTVLVPRVLAVSLVLNPAVAGALVPLVVPAFLVGALFIALLWRSSGGAPAQENGHRGSPLRLVVAIQMAVAFQVAMWLIEYVQHRWASPGLYTTAAFLGVTDVDALTVSMNRQPDGVTPAIAARVIAVGIIANSVSKFVLAAVLGRGRFRVVAGAALLATAVTTFLVVWWR